MSASESALPSKLFFRIGEVASLVGVEPHVLRYWEREFRSIRPTKSAKGQRVYSRKDVENLLRVRDLLYRDGFTIAGAKKRLQRGTEPAPVVDPASPGDARLRRIVDDIDPSLADEEDEEELAAAEEPESGPRSHSAHSNGPSEPASVREKLTALRAEVESFLHELERGEHI